MSGHRTARLNGLTVRYRIDGDDPDAPWIVFSNSLATDLGVWDAQVDLLAPRWRVLRYDQRGHGGTAVPSSPCDFRQLAADVVALLDHVGIDRCTFVGLSMGVPTALAATVEHPRRFERLVLCDGQAATAVGGAELWEQRLTQARAGGMTAFAEATVARWFAPDFVAAGRADRVRDMVAATPFVGLAACVRALQDFDCTGALGAIRVPTLLIVGARDGALPVTMAAMRERIAGASLVEIPDAGHIPNVEQPAAFNAALTAFLGAVGG